MIDAAAIRVPPPVGSPYGVALPGTEEPDRTPIYRHWRFKDSGLLETLDPKVSRVVVEDEDTDSYIKIRTIHDAFEATGESFVVHLQQVLNVAEWLDNQNRIVLVGDRGIR
jgi:hypothetical protein